MSGVFAVSGLSSTSLSTVCRNPVQLCLVLLLRSLPIQGRWSTPQKRPAFGNPPQTSVDTTVPEGGREVRPPGKATQNRLNCPHHVKALEITSRTEEAPKVQIPLRSTTTRPDL